jgi:hypothetical protein
MSRHAPLWLFLLALAACGGSSDGSIDPTRLGPDYLLWSHRVELCSIWIVLDVDKVLQSRGCESGAIQLHTVRSVDESTKRDGLGRYEKLPEADVMATACPNGNRHEFKRSTKGQVQSWVKCGTAGGLDDVTGLPDDFSSIVQFMQDLTTPH